MKSNISNQSVRYNVWNKDQCQEVVNSAFRILEITGCEVQNKNAKQLLKEAGCIVVDNNVKIPFSLSQWAVKQAPSVVTLYDRKGKPAIKLSPYHVNFGPGITLTQIVDYKTGERRQGRKTDVADIAHLIDALPNIAWASALISIADVNYKIADIAEINILLKNTIKPIMYWAHSTENLQYEFEMFEEIAGGEEAFKSKPFAINLICPISPLTHTDNGMEQVMYMAKKRAPMTYIAGVGFGLSGPITLPGSIAVGLADTLVGLIVSQLINPGTPFVASKFNDNINMKTLTMAHSRPELIIAQCATSDVFRFLDLPFCSNFGNTDSGILDPIASFDKAIQLYSCMLSGTNMSFAIGSYEAGALARLEDFVLCNEIIEYVKVLVDGINLSEESLAEDVVDDIGPGGNFISSPHTIEHIHDYYVPDLMEPITFDQANTLDNNLQNRLQKRISEILSVEVQNSLSKKASFKLDEILERAEKELSSN